MKFCEECGAKLEDDAVFCEECGAVVASETTVLKNTDEVESEITESEIPDEVEHEITEPELPDEVKHKITESEVLDEVEHETIEPDVAFSTLKRDNIQVEKQNTANQQTSMNPNDLATNKNVAPENVAHPKKNGSKKIVIGVCAGVVAVGLVVVGCIASGVFSGNGKKDSASKEEMAMTSATAVITQAPTEVPTQAGTDTTVVPEPTPVVTEVPVATQEQKSNTYILENSDKEYLSESTIKALSKKQRRYARNEIYARHGYIFKDKALKKYFSKKAWYKPTVKAADFSESVLNKFEKKNAALISQLENASSSSSDIAEIQRRWEGVFVSYNDYGYEELTIEVKNATTISYTEMSYDNNGSGSVNESGTATLTSDWLEANTDGTNWIGTITISDDGSSIQTYDSDFNELDLFTR